MAAFTSAHPKCNWNAFFFTYRCILLIFQRLTQTSLFTELKCKPQTCNWKVSTDRPADPLKSPCYSLAPQVQEASTQLSSSWLGVMIKSTWSPGPAKPAHALVMRNRPELTAAFSQGESQQSRWIASPISHSEALGKLNFKPPCLLFQIMCCLSRMSFFSPFCLFWVGPLTSSTKCFTPLSVPSLQSCRILTGLLIIIKCWVGGLKLPKKYALLQSPRGAVCSGAACLLCYSETCSKCWLAGGAGRQWES